MSSYPIPMTPMVNAGLLYINGLQLSWVSNTEISVAPGQARDARNINDIFSPEIPRPPFDGFDQSNVLHYALDSSALSVPQAISVLSTFVGAGGLDEGVIGNNLLYAVYVIGSSAGGDPSSRNDYVPTSAILSLNDDQPILPVGYDMFRRIGYVLTDGGGLIIQFAQVGDGSDRWMMYNSAIVTDIALAENAGTAAVDEAPINMRSSTFLSIPADAMMVKMLVKFTAKVAADSVFLQPFGAVDESYNAIYTGAVVDIALYSVLDCPCDSLGRMNYWVSNADDGITLSVQGYMDSL